MKKRLVLDAVMTVLIVAAMLNQLTGQFAHEIIGTVLVVAFVVHLVTGRKMLAAVRRQAGKESGFGHGRQLMAVFCLLCVALVLVIVSALIISRILMVAGSYLSDLDSGGGYVWSKIHVTSAYALAICVLFHLALHWSVVVGSLRQKAANGPRAGAAGKALAGVACVAGVALAVLCGTRLSYYAAAGASSSYEPSGGVTKQLEEAYSGGSTDATSNSSGEGTEGLGIYNAGDPRAKADGSKSPDVGAADESASSDESSDAGSDAQSFVDAVSSATQ